MNVLLKVNLKYRSLMGQQVVNTLRLVSNDVTNSTSGYISYFKQLGFSEDVSVQLSNNKHIQKHKIKELNNVLNTIQKLGFTKEDGFLEYPEIFNTHPFVITNRFKTLEECGVSLEKISLKLIRGFARYCKKTASHLKKEGIIDEKTDITRNILSYCDLPINLYPSATDSQPFTIIQENAIKSYLMWLFDLTTEDIERGYRLYTYSNRSIRVIKENFDILLNKLEFPKEKIRRHMYLLNNNPDNVLDILKHVPFINSKPIRDVAYIHPKMLVRPTDTILEIIQILKDFNIDEKSAALHPAMFTLAPNTVRERIQIFLTDPKYKYLANNNQLYKCITNFSDLTRKANILEESRWRCYSTNILLSGKNCFDIRYKMNPDYYKGSDIIHLIRKEMNLAPKAIQNSMSQHVLWNYVPLKTISSTLDFLRQAGFTDNQISSALTVLLYPKKEVEKCIKELDGNSEVDCCRDSSTGKVRPELILQLVLYFLERPFHFTGNGVWELDPTYTEQPH